MTRSKGLIRHLMAALPPRRWRLPAGFDAAGYRRTSPDLAPLSDLRLMLHFLRHGRREGRLPCALRAARLEAEVWAGQDAARAALAQPMTGDEALWARVALARLAGAAGDWPQVAALLAGQAQALADRLGLAAPFWLMAEAALHLGDRDGAAQALRWGATLARRDPAAPLLRAALAGWQDGAGWHSALQPLYHATGLAAPELRPALPGVTPFDRLTTPGGPAIHEGPLVSVILPARNAGATIDTALAGLVAQSWQMLEVLVIDNGSTDDTARRAAGWAMREPRIRLLDGRQARGAYEARNLGLAAASGEVIALHDADDWSHPDRIARQMQAMAAAPASLSHWARMSAGLIPGCWRPDLPVVHPNLSSLMIRRAVVARIGAWDRVRAGADSEFIARLRQVFGAGAVAEVMPGVPLAFGRQRAGSLSRDGATGLLGAGAAARADYLAAAAEWHRQAGQPCLPPYGPRPFAAPAALIPDAEGTP
ncbi:glycosyltransferase family 2 protein [Tabrizicola fusiformis]|uniref:glycosyltransferase family 2 protein n=1 Tax=Tabrizicola sp. SY72 TaxID=2741673 RepID=UPI001572F930|nr:glycosyltransferase family A protein [Tabrizicola sp. SY72]NTT87267.1 glycosyltransferase family 2 protein [Tabrizicola sp. SY72]